LKILADNWDEIADDMGNTYEDEFDAARDELGSEAQYDDEMK
jgi:hypothetical protein